MLTIYIKRDADDTDDTAACYAYVVRVNDETIAAGRVEGHKRIDGWRALVRRVLRETNK